MITHELALRLREVAPVWSPGPGDRFVIPHSDFDEVFVIADMVIEAHDVPGGRVVRFNGTTEWALDSVDAARVLWLPREDQLRDMCGARFVRLDRVGDGFAVELDDGSRHVDTDAERAYARAAIAVLTGQGSAG